MLPDIEDCPRAAVTRLVHYFETYKLAPGTADRPCEGAAVYGRADCARRARGLYDGDLAVERRGRLLRPSRRSCGGRRHDVGYAQVGTYRIAVHVVDNAIV